MRIALATCSTLPDWEVDDRPLHDALLDREVELLQPAWDDASFDYESVDACLVRTTWDYTSRCEEFCAWAERTAELTRFYNPPDIIQWNTRKTYLRDLAAVDIPTIPTVWLDRGAVVDLSEIMREHEWPRAFLKPVVGSTAYHTLRFDHSPTGIELARRHLDEHLDKQMFLLQPYLDSVETFGEVSAVWIDGEVTHGVRKVPVAGDYRVQDDYGAHDEPYIFGPSDRAMIDRLFAPYVDRLLYGRADFLRDAEGQLLLTEFEVVEPSLFLRHGLEAADRLADALLERVRTSPKPAADGAASRRD